MACPQTVRILKRKALVAQQNSVPEHSKITFNRAYTETLFISCSYKQSMSDRRTIFLKKKAIKQKLLIAEKKISALRLLVVLFNTAVFIFLFEGRNTNPVLAYSVIITAILYSLFTIYYKPYLKYPLFLSSYFTSITDAVLISLWIIATGGYDSPFFVLWYASIVAIAFRYTAMVTILTSILYAILYLGIILVGTKNPDTTDAVVRVGYIFLVGLLGGVFSKDSLVNIEDKLKIRDSEKALIRAQKELEERIQERTKALASSNQHLKKEIKVRSEIEKEQFRLLRELEKSNSDLESFAHIVSHDLKAPLRAIGSISDWLYEDLKHQVHNESMEQLLLIKTRVRRLNELIDGILRFSKIGRVPEEKEQFNTGEVIDDVLDMLRIPENIKVEMQPGLPELLFEKTLFIQVMQNLISNAIKYMDKERGLIKIAAKDAGGFLEFSVSDNGPGIEGKYHEKIFQIFQTLKARDEFESTGIGLTIVKKIIETAGGKIWLNSELGKGTCFYFTVQQRIVREKSLA